MGNPPMFRRSRNKNQLGFRLPTQSLADALAAAAAKSNTTPGIYARQVLIEHLGGGPTQKLTEEFRGFAQAMRSRLDTQDQALANLQATLDAFREAFQKALH